MIRELLVEEAVNTVGGSCTRKRVYFLPDSLGIADGGVAVAYTGDPAPSVTSYVPPAVTPTAPVGVQSVGWLSGSQMAHDLYMQDKYVNDYNYGSSARCISTVD
jgi:hypothetical protein